MKRFLLIAVLLVLLFTFIGCSQGDGSKNTDTKENIGTTTPSTDNSADEDTADEPYYGQWQIVKVLGFAPASTYSMMT